MSSSALAIAMRDTKLNGRGELSRRKVSNHNFGNAACTELNGRAQRARFRRTS